MLKKYGISEEKIFNVPVIATMSSGKSTFINALLGEDLLPSKNQACTARILPIIDKDNMENFSANVIYKSGERRTVMLSNEEISDFNNDSTIENLLIEGDIKGIKNYSKSLVIYDTPGANFSGDVTHQEITYDFISKFKKGLLIYLINATQFGINDDKELLENVIDKVNKSNGKIEVLYVVNKIDQFDIEKEDIKETIKEIKQYLINTGANKPKIIPISALAAKVFKKVIAEKELSRRELRDFYNYYELFEPKEYCLSRYAILDEEEKGEMVKIGGEKIEKASIIQAINNTGITLVEDTIDSYLKMQDKIDDKEITMKNKSNNKAIKIQSSNRSRKKRKKKK